MIFKELWGTLLWLVKELLFEDFRNYVAYQARDNDLIILGNGPSLNKDIHTLLKQFESSDCCVVNDFCQSSFFLQIKPVYYVLADPMYFNELWQREPERKTIKMLTQVSWNMSLFIPYNMLHFDVVNKLRQNTLLTIMPFHTNEYSGVKRMRTFLYKRGLTMPRIQNVLIPSIFNMINMGYHRIYLYGVDHSWTKDMAVNEKNQVCLINNHFYQKSLQMDPWKKCNGEQYKMYEILRDLAYMFEGYHLLREYADFNNCKVYNMTPESFIDAFERL